MKGVLLRGTGGRVTPDETKLPISGIERVLVLRVFILSDGSFLLWSEYFLSDTFLVPSPAELISYLSWSVQLALSWNRTCLPSKLFKVSVSDLSWSASVYI